MTLSLLPGGAEEPELDDSRFPAQTDAGNAKAFADALGHEYAYVPEWEMWIAWSGTHWELDGAELRAMRACITLFQQLQFRSRAAVVRLTDELRIERIKMGPNIDKISDRLAYEQSLAKWYIGSQNAGRLSSCLRVAACLLIVRITDLDRDPWLFNAKNGTIDLQTGELRPHSPKDLLTQVASVDYDADAKAPAWHRFLNQCMHDSAHLTLYLQRAVGYALSGTIKEHALVFHYGNGSNGKSTFFKVLRALFGNYAVAAPRTLLFEQRNGQSPHPTELARLYGKRLAICAEIGEDHSFDEAKVKDLTGDDVISCRRINENYWDLRPTHKLHIAGNYKPTIKGADEGIWRRVRLVPWTASFLGREDTSLGDTLRKELPGILAWAVAGCLEWQKHGLAEPEEVTEAVGEYRADSDVFGEFLRTHCAVVPDAKMARKTLRETYETWCEELGHKPVGARKLGERLRAYKVSGTTIRHDGKVLDAWEGIRLLADFERQGSQGAE